MDELIFLVDNVLFFPKTIIKFILNYFKQLKS